MNYVYMLRCGDGSLYTGWTNNLQKRLAAHAAGRGGKYTASHLPVALAYCEVFETRSEAMRQEVLYKQLPREQKLRLTERYQAMKHLLFDLDGTLTDPKIGITKSVAHALRAYGIEVDDLDTLTPFIGPPLSDSFEEFYGFSHEQAVEAVEKYREYFSVTGLFENRVYDGIPETLAALRARGYHLFVATSKPTFFARQILDHFALTQFFDDIVGSELDGSRVKKADVIRWCMEKNALTDAVMIGDRSYDIRGAAACGLSAVGVTFGYGSEDELREAGAKHLCRTPQQLLELFF